MHLQIHDAVSGTQLVDARDEMALKIEGNWYVDPATINSAHLELTKHEYTCPYKGTCHYVDFVDGERRIERVAWVYADPKSGWEHIAGRYGFYAGETAGRFGKTKETLTP